MADFRKLLKGLFSMIACVVFFFILLIVILFLSSMVSDDVEMFIISVVLFAAFIVIALIPLTIYGVVCIISYVKAKNKLQSIHNFSVERFEREIKLAPKIKNILLCSDAICFYGNGGTIKTVPIEEIVWAYQNDEGQTAYLNLCLYDKTQLKVPITIKRKNGTPYMACRYMLRLIARKSPGVMIGYSEELDAMLKDRFHEMVSRVRQTELIDSRLLEQEYIKNNYYVKDFH